MMIAAALLCCVLPVASNARLVELRFEDGRVIVGQWVAQDEDHVTVEVAGIQTPFPMTTVTELNERLSVENIYRERREALADDNLQGRYELARFLFDQDAFDLARAELTDLLGQYPTSQKLRSLLNTTEARLKLDRGGASPAEKSLRGVAEGGVSTTANAAANADPRNPLHKRRPGMLTEYEVNVIKVWELAADITQTKPTVRVPRETMLEVFVEYAGDPLCPSGPVEQRNWLQKPHFEQLDLIFRLQARDHYPDVTVNSEPKPLTAFRKGLYREYVARYFTNNFGGGQVPGLELRRRSGTIPFYTNFYILSVFEQPPAAMIDRTDPEQSLLLQWGLPRQAAKYPAPDVRGWRPYFDGVDDPKFRAFVDTIAGLQSPRPLYGIAPDLRVTE